MKGSRGEKDQRRDDLWKESGPLTGLLLLLPVVFGHHYEGKRDPSCWPILGRMDTWLIFSRKKIDCRYPGQSFQCHFGLLNTMAARFPPALMRKVKSMTDCMEERSTCEIMIELPLQDNQWSIASHELNYSTGEQPQPPWDNFVEANSGWRTAPLWLQEARPGLQPADKWTAFELIVDAVAHLLYSWTF